MKAKVLSSILISICLFIFGFWVVNRINLSANDSSDYKLEVSINGAVQNEGTYFIERGTMKKDFIYSKHLLPSADIKRIDLDGKIEKDATIFIPYKEGMAPKIKVNENTSLANLSGLKVSLNVKKSIVKLIKDNKGAITWDMISGLDGVGSKTLDYLKSRLDISSP